MSQATSIEWTDISWNPVHGCSKVSPGCAHCYAETISRQYGQTHTPWTPANAAKNVILKPHKLREPLSGAKVWRGLGAAAAAAGKTEGKLVFVNSMSDLFHEEVPDEFILAIWAVMEACPQHTFQILTKRPERMRELLADAQAAPTPRGDVPYERRELADYPGYEIDTDGVVWGARLGRPMSPDVGEQGHRRVMLYRGGGTYRELVHRLVLATFDRAAARGEQGRHLDGDPGNNRLSNLAWGTQADNWADSKGHRTDRRYSKLDPRQVARLRIGAASGESATALASQFGISDTQVRNIVRGDQWGFKVLPNVMLGVSIENRRYVDRADLLRETPAAVRFVSAEPLLGPVVWDAFDPAEERFSWSDGYAGPDLETDGLDWVIIGGESGRGHRPMSLSWARDLSEDCRGNGVAVFVKQLGGARPGDRLEDLPEDLRIRNFPKVQAVPSA